MHFEPDEAQRMLADSLGALLADRYDFQARQAYLAMPQGFSPAMWAAYAEMGLLGMPFAQEDGGYGLGPVETLIVAEAFGGALCLEPFLSAIVLAGGVLRHAADAEQRARLVPLITEGALRPAFAHTERGAGYDLAFVETRARRDGTGYRLDGEKILVWHGDSADLLVVSARSSGEAGAQAGLSLLLVDPKAPGVVRRGYRTQDGLRACDITFHDVSVAADQRLGAEGEAFGAILRACDETLAALCAEAVGAMVQAHALTIEHLKTRRQFGVTIGSFQALQHRAADMLVAIEQARSMALYATMMLDAPTAAVRGRAMHAAKLQIDRSARLVGQQAIQLHGGVGITEEYAVAHYFKRLTMIALSLGDADHHLARLAELGSLMED